MVSIAAHSDCVLMGAVFISISLVLSQQWACTLRLVPCVIMVCRPHLFYALPLLSRLLHWYQIIPLGDRDTWV